jgi:hypothetical protein
MALRVKTWYDLRDFLQEQVNRLEQLHEAVQHPLLTEAIEAHLILQKHMAELCAEHGITLEED